MFAFDGGLFASPLPSPVASWKGQDGKRASLVNAKGHVPIFKIQFTAIIRG